MTRINRAIIATALKAAVVVGMLVVGSGAQSQFLAQRSTVGNYLAGVAATRDFHTAEAASFLNSASVEQWDNPLVLERAFFALAMNGDIERAVEVARRLNTVARGHPLAELLLAADALKQRRYPAAARELKDQIDDSFEGIAGIALRAWALIGNGEIAAATAALDEFGEGGLDEFFVFHRALMAEVAGRDEDALRFIAAARDLEGQSGVVIEAFARIYGNAGRFEEALATIAAYERLGLSDPKVIHVKQVLSQHRRPGRFADSVQAGAAELFFSIGGAYARDGNVSIALFLQRLAQHLGPTNDRAALAVAQLYDGAGRHAVANAIYEAVPPTSPLKPAAIVRVASNLNAMGERQDAIRRLKNITTARPDDFEAIFALGGLLREEKDYLGSADAYGLALKATGGREPGDWRLYYMRGIAYERAGQFPRAEVDFLAALELNPGEPQVLNYLGYSWVDKGINLARALGMVQQAAAAAPNDAYIIDSLGWAYYRLGRFGEAIEELERAVALRPADPEINDHLGDAYWRAGRKLEARFQWNVAISVDAEGIVKKRAAPKLETGLDAVPVVPAAG